MKKIPLITMDSNSRSLGTFIENFKGIIEFEGHNDKVLEDQDKLVVFFEYVGDNDYTFETFTNFFKTYEIPTFLVIDDSYEGLTDNAFLALVEKTVQDNPYIVDWVILTNNKLLNTKNKIYFNVQLHLDRYDGIDIRNHLNKDWNGNSNLRKKKFLCLNRQERMHRLQVTHHLLKNDIAKHTYLSCPLGAYEHVFNGNNTQQEHRKYLDKGLHGLWKLSDDFVGLLKDNLPIELDLNEVTYKSMSRSLPSADEYYKESYFSIITEGDFWDDNRQAFTEKALKCFLYKHPFIVVGLKGTLALLRELGFMTFSQLIDESYDNEKDPTKRLAMAMVEVDKLNSYNIHELQNMYNELNDILDYNREHYLNLFRQKQPVELLHKINSFVND
jgi:hypothetical protein